MSDKDHIIASFSEIPPVFYSDLTSKPFRECINCGKNLLNPGTLYMIEKAIVQTQPHRTKNTIYEYAMCFDCWEETRKTLSQESLKRIAAYFANRVDMEKRRKQLEKSTDVDDWLNACIVSGEPIESMNEYQIACQCDGQYMAYHYLPYLLSGKVAEELMGLLSAKTLGEMDDFKRRLTTPSPDLEELFTKPKLLLV